MTTATRSDNLTLSRQIVHLAGNVIFNKCRDRIGPDNDSPQAYKALNALYSTHDTLHRFGAGHVKQSDMCAFLEDAVPAVGPGDAGGCAQLLRDAIVAVYALVEVSE